MKRTSIVAALVLLLTSVVVSSAAAQVVQRVIDGDTLAIAGVGTVRLIGVDTPETVDPRKPVQYFGREASAFLQQLVAGKTVRLEYDQQRTDKYARTLAYLYLLDGTFVNAEIIKQGYGHAYTAFPFRYMEAFREYEREARGASRGLWATVPITVIEAPPAPGQRVTVYVTRTGEKYHAAGCRYLARSQIPMALAEAVSRYGACSVCSPPTLKPTAVSTTVVAAPSSPRSSTPIRAGRCQATTKKGMQCSRNAQSGRSYCWQH